MLVEEWIELLGGKEGGWWKWVGGVYEEEKEMGESVLEKNGEIYGVFRLWSGGGKIIYVKGYD